MTFKKSTRAVYSRRGFDFFKLHFSFLDQNFQIAENVFTVSLKLILYYL